ncbi:hypothetical protein BH11PLA1_BH11PLA1_02220 [soil metagenome]
MLKLIKRYNKILLIFLGIVLMVAFLLGDVLKGGFGHLGGAKGYKLNGEEISTLQIAEAHQRLQLLKQNLPWKVAILSLDKGNEADHWVLLAEAARRAGLVGPDGEAIAYFTEEYPIEYTQGLMQQMRAKGQRMTSEEITSTLESMKQRGEQLAHVGAPQPFRDITLAGAVAEYKGIERLISAYGAAPRLGQERIVERIARQADRAVYRYVLIPIDEKQAAALPDPDEAALRAFFTQHQNLDPRGSEFGVGYILPPRVHMKWLTIDAKAVAAQVTVRTLDVEKRLRELPPDANTPAADRRAKAEAALKQEQVARIIADAETAVKAEILRVTAGLADEKLNGRTGKRLPDNWEQIKPDLAAIGVRAAQRVNEKYAISIPAFKVDSVENDWQTEVKLSSLPGIGAAVLKRERGDVPFATVALQTRELLTERDRDPSVALQTGIPLSEPLVGRDGSAYYPLITATRGASGPETLAEIRPQVIADFKRVEAYKALAARTADLLQAAKAKGLAPLAAETTVDGAPLRVENEVFAQRALGQGEQPTLATPQSKVRPWMRAVPNFLDQIVGHAEALDPTSPIAAQDADKRFFALAAPNARALALVELIGYEPLTKEMLRDEIAKAERRNLRIGENFARQSTMQGVDNPFAANINRSSLDSVDEPFSLKRMIERLKVTDMKLREE